MYDILAGFIVAVLSGLGIGGGGLLVIYLTLAGVGQLEAQGINLVYFLFSSGAAMLVHMTRRRLRLPLIVLLALSGIVGAVCGSLLARSVDPMILRRTFGVLLFVSGTLALTAK